MYHYPLSRIDADKFARGTLWQLWSMGGAQARHALADDIQANMHHLARCVHCQDSHNLHAVKVASQLQWSYDTLSYSVMTCASAHWHPIDVITAADLPGSTLGGPMPCCQSAAWKTTYDSASEAAYHNTFLCRLLNLVDHQRWSFGS